MIKLVFIIILILILIGLTFIDKPKQNIEGASFTLDPLQLPKSLIPIKEADIRKLVRIPGIGKHVKMDKYDRIERITYSKPKPESGETKCFTITCPSWLSEVVCWKCM